MRGVFLSVVLFFSAVQFDPVSAQRPLLVTPDPKGVPLELEKPFINQDDLETKSADPESETNTPPRAEISRTKSEDLAAPSFSPSPTPSPEPRSDLEQVFAGRFPTDVSTELKQFGYDLFAKPSGDFLANKDIPVGTDYIIGPGDVFTINVWGSANFSYPVKVKSDGTIFIPKIGSIKVWGQTSEKMKQTIRKQLSNYFSGIHLAISFDVIRNIEVFMVGEVVKPGTYSISSTSSPINALFYAGGATKRGSLRNIQVFRNNVKIATVDLYQFLISGSQQSLQLNSQDVILVPVIGKVAAIAGGVKRPAIYELAPESMIHDLIEMAGGLSFTGAVGRLSLSRVEENKTRVTKDFQIPDGVAALSRGEILKTELGSRLRDGDLVRIFPVLAEMKKTVYLKGHVKRPGEYEFRDGMRIRSLISSYDVFLAEPYTRYIQIIRTVLPDDKKISLFVNVDTLLAGDSAQNIELHERDEIYAFSKNELNLREKVCITGKVNKPGDYYFFDGMTLRDLVYMAGNVTQDAYLPNAEIARYTILSDQVKAERIQVNLSEVLQELPKENPKLLPKDKVFVRGIPDWEFNNFIHITGEIRFPGDYSFLKGERLSRVLERAGGFTDKAFLPGSVFNRVSVRQIQQKSLQEQIANLETAILQESLNPSQPLSAEDQRSFQEAVIARKALLKNLQAAEVTGRMVIRVSNLSKFKGSDYDIPLEGGDSLFIPPIPSVVTVMGEVYNQTSVVYKDGESVRYYLEKVGGTTSNADNESIFVIKADGSVVSRKQNRGFLLRNFYQMGVSRGDTILVPKDIRRFSWLNTTKDITEILFKIASTTGITITALK